VHPASTCKTVVLRFLERVSGYSRQQLKGLRAIDVAHLFPSSAKRSGIRRGGEGDDPGL